VELAAGHLHVARAVGQSRDAVEAQHLDVLRLAFVVDDERTALDRGDVLVRMETEDADVAKAADRLATPARADGERGVLDDAQLAFSGQRVERVHVAW